MPVEYGSLILASILSVILRNQARSQAGAMGQWVQLHPLLVQLHPLTFRLGPYVLHSMGGAFQKKLVGQNESLTKCSTMLRSKTRN